MTRNCNLYVSSQLNRWLHWIAEMRCEELGESHTADSIAEEILRRAISTNIPMIDVVEAEYRKARKKLDQEAIGRIKAGEPETCEVPPPNDSSQPAAKHGIA